MTPYYRSQDGRIVVYHCSIEALIASGMVPIEEVALVHGDPPYGVNANTRGVSSGRGLEAGGRAGRDINGRGRPKSREYEPIFGDDRPYDPSPILALDRRTVLWGANHYGKVPGSPSWIYWEKRGESGPDDGADGELAWTNLGGPLRSFEHVWRGTCRASETGVPHLYATQKPVALMLWIFRERTKLKPGDLVLVPYLGSGPEIAAADKLGLRLIGCDVSEAACRIACSARLGAVVKPEPVDKLGPLFARR